MLKSVTLLGSSSGRNAGDAALIAAIMDSVDVACGKCLLYEIPTIKPEFIWRSYENRVRPVSILPWNGAVKIFGIPTWQSVMRTDLSLVFDAVLFDRSLYNPLFNFLSTFSLFLPRAKRRGKKLGFFNVTAGPVTTPQGKEMLRRLSDQMDFITVRDQSSYDILQELGVKNPNMLVTADAALNARAANRERVDEILRSLGLENEPEFLAINVNPYIDTWAGTDKGKISKEEFVNIFSRAVSRIAAEIGVPLLFLGTQHLDVPLTKEIMARVTGAKKKVLFTNVDHDHRDVKGVMSRASLLFAMRLHAIILTSSALTPVLGLNYLPKVNHYFKTLGLEEFNLSFENFSEENVVAHLRNGWEKRAAQKRVLEERIPFFQNEANKAAELVRAIHEGEDISRVIARLRNPRLTPVRQASGV